MNKDVNRTLTALVPILRMNGEMVKSIEAVNDWYKVGDREYLKEVAEITYDNGARRYADIGCDSNLTAVFDVVAVIQQIKPRSSAIERIERGVYRQYPIENIPAAEVKPVVRGSWVNNQELARFACSSKGMYQCSECKQWIDVFQMSGEMNYCPNCGSDMREGSKNDQELRQRACETVP